MISKFLRYTVFTIVCSLFLMVALTSAQPKKQDGTDKTVKTDKQNKGAGTSDSTTNKKKEIVFPEVDGWEKGAIQTFPTAELGYSIAYSSEEGDTVTVYVYNGGQKNISDDVTDKVIKSELDRAKNDIKEIGKAGLYKNVKEIKSETVTLGGADGKVKALRSQFTFTARGQEVNSEIYLFGFQNNFIKIRATRPIDQTNAKPLADLLSEIDLMFAK